MGYSGRNQSPCFQGFAPDRSFTKSPHSNVCWPLVVRSPTSSTLVSTTIIGMADRFVINAFAPAPISRSSTSARSLHPTVFEYRFVTNVIEQHFIFNEAFVEAEDDKKYGLCYSSEEITTHIIWIQEPQGIVDLGHGYT